MGTLASSATACSSARRSGREASRALSKSWWLLLYPRRPPRVVEVGLKISGGFWAGYQTYHRLVVVGSR